MQSLLNELNPDVWPQIKPLFDEAMAKLGDKDRDAIVLRFFEGKPLSAVGVALGTSEDAAKMRVNRALERLRKFFAGRGVTLSATTVGSVIAANVVQAAPTTLTASVLATVGSGAIVAASTLTLVKGVLELVTITKLKLGVISAAVALGMATPLVLQQQANARLRDENRALRLQTAQPPPAPTPQSAVDESELARIQQEHLELLRLRGEVGRLRTQEKELAKLRAAGRNSPAVSPTTPQPGPIDLPKDSWTDAGFTTPQAVLQTRGWAVLNGNRERFKESLHITDGAKKILEGMVEQMIATAPDPAVARKQIADNGLGMEDAMLFPMIAENQNKNYTGYRVLSQQSPSSDQAIFEVETTMVSGAAKQETLKFQKFGNDWKVMIDEEMLRAQLRQDSK
jgi:Sigma-70, region 4